MPSANKEIHRTYQQRHYAKNKKYYKDRRAARKKQQLQRFVAFKSTLSCALCSEDDIAALDLHHVDEKESLISQLLKNSCGWSRIIAEIEKCICLCANCHRKVHTYAEWASRLKPTHKIVVPEEFR